MARHWSEWYGCSCGFRTLSYAKDAQHRHNFPALCKKRRTSHSQQGSKAEKVPAAQAARQDTRDIQQVGSTLLEISLPGVRTAPEHVG